MRFLSEINYTINIYKYKKKILILILLHNYQILDIVVLIIIFTGKIWYVQESIWHCPG